MAIRKTLQYGNSVLATKAKTVSLEDIPTEKTQNLIKDLTDTALDSSMPLVGIAATQVATWDEENVRILVMKALQNDQWEPLGDHMVFINPEILALSLDRQVLYEGCGSFLDYGMAIPVNRSFWVTVRTYNQVGELLEFSLRGKDARIAQHEIDHLEGTLMIDKKAPWYEMIPRSQRLTVNEELMKQQTISQWTK